MMKTLLKKLLIITVLIGSCQVFSQTTTINTDATHINLIGDLLKSDGGAGYISATTTYEGDFATGSEPSNFGVSIKNSAAVFFVNYKGSSSTNKYKPTTILVDTPSAGRTTNKWEDNEVNKNVPLKSGAVPVVGETLKWTFKVEATSAVTNLTVVDFTLGVEDVDLKDDINIVLYPNPVQNTLQINALNSIDSIEIFNLLGQKVMEQKGSNAINVRSLSKGNYIVKIFQENETVSTKRFIKK